MFKYLWLVIIVIIGVVWGIMAVIDIIRALKELRKYDKWDFDDLACEVDESTLAFFGLLFLAVFVLSFIMFVLSKAGGGE